MNRVVKVITTDLEELTLESLSRGSRTSEQIRHYLEGRGVDASSYEISRGLAILSRAGLVTRRKMARVYKYTLKEITE